MAQTYPEDRPPRREDVPRGIPTIASMMHATGKARRRCNSIDASIHFCEPLVSLRMKVRSSGVSISEKARALCSLGGAWSSAMSPVCSSVCENPSRPSSHPSTIRECSDLPCEAGCGYGAGRENAMALRARVRIGPVGCPPCADLRLPGGVVSAMMRRFQVEGPVPERRHRRRAPYCR